MKKSLYSLLFTLLLVSCSKSNINNRNCRFLLDVGVNTSINMNIFPYSSLLFESNSVYVPNVGNAGIIVTNSGIGFLAWDASDPNRIPTSCSTMTINGLECVSNCPEENSYSLITGQSLTVALECGLKAYRVEINGSNLFISNF